MKRRFIQRASWLIALLLAFSLAFSGCDAADGAVSDDKNGDLQSSQPSSSANSSQNNDTQGTSASVSDNADSKVDINNIPEYSGKAYVALNGNVPDFTAKEKTDKTAYEFYSDLDELGRCGVTHACIGKELMPTEARESISSVKPSGWINKEYDADLVDGRYIYNRCHLIGFQLTGENANKENLITGTRYMNVQGMLPFEDMVADYIKETGNHVMYRVTPVFKGNELVARGVIMEAYSIEDKGEGICFNVYVYNVQPGIVIDYATGNSWLSGEDVKETDAPENNGEEKAYVLNTSTKKVHLPTCSNAKNISDSNRQEYVGNIQNLFDNGYTACGTCKPAA